MDGKENIVGAILDEAALSADSLLSKARENAEKIVSSATAEANSYVFSQAEIASKDAESIIRNKRTLSNLDTRKNILDAKQKLVGKVYSLAVEKLNALSKKEYLSIIEKLIQDNASENETVVLSQKSPVKLSDIKALKIVTERNLSVKFDGKFSGGIIIESETCDKNLTFESVVETLKAETESEIAGKLFE